MRTLATSLRTGGRQGIACLLLTAALTVPGTAWGGQPELAALTFSLVLDERAGGDTQIGTARVMLDTTPQANVRMVQGWSYTICAQAVEIVDVVRGSDLDRLCSQRSARRCDIEEEDGLITVDLLISDTPSQGILEVALDNWEDLIISYRCPGIACDTSGLWFCPREVNGADQYATFLIGGEELFSAEGGNRRLLLCNTAEKLSVMPALKPNGDVGIYLHAAAGTTSCLMTGWTYAVCFEGDIDVVELSDPEEFTGEDTLQVRGEGPPKYNLVRYLPGEGIIRSVVVDFMQPIGVDAPLFAGGFEDLTIRLADYPCGALRICSGEIGEPKVFAHWNNAKEDSLDMTPEHMGRLDLCWRRGDTNFDGRVNVGDAVNVLTCLFDPARGVFCDCVRTTEYLCAEPFNINGDERWNVADAVYLLNFTFLNGPPIPPLE